MLQTTDYNPTASGKATKMDRFIRWVIIPAVLIIGVYGLVLYAVTGEGQGTKPVAPSVEGATIAL